MFCRFSVACFFFIVYVDMFVNRFTVKETYFKRNQTWYRNFLKYFFNCRWWLFSLVHHFFSTHWFRQSSLIKQVSWYINRINSTVVNRLIIPDVTSCEGYNVFDQSVSQSISPSSFLIINTTPSKPQDGILLMKSCRYLGHSV